MHSALWVSKTGMAAQDTKMTANDFISERQMLDPVFILRSANFYRLDFSHIFGMV